MPRAKIDPGPVRAKILEAAVSLLDGNFERLTMKDLAGHLGMSVGYLYRFFRCKDEIYLTLVNQYYSDLYEALLKTLADYPDPGGKVEGVIRSFYEMAIGHYPLYQLVMRPPRVLTDFLGGDMEQLALVQHQSSLRWMDLVKATILGYCAVRGKSTENASLEERFLFIFSHLHGLIEHRHSRIMPYLASDPQAMQEKQLTLLVEYALS